MSRIAFGILGFLAVMIAAPQFSQSTPSTPSNTGTAQFDTYQRPNGDAYFALALTPQAALPSAPACELVVLFDTSASQLGKYREKGLEVLRGLLATLGDHDRVKLMAVDVNAIPLTDTFVDPRGSEMQAALEKLNRRVPLAPPIWKQRLSLPRIVIKIGRLSNARPCTSAMDRAMQILRASMLPD